MILIDYVSTFQIVFINPITNSTISYTYLISHEEKIIH